MTVSKTAMGESEASGNAYQDTARSRLDGRPTAWVTKADLADVRVRRWLKSAHRSFGSWARVAAVLKLSSKGKAQHIAEGRAPVHLRELEEDPQQQSGLLLQEGRLEGVRANEGRSGHLGEIPE